ncbi:hypothetical protein PHMEG_00028338 [Phytophthora megakarya]|uniref:Uncharacterized protein n=1 Tax=Phytophthora megakarya TaxID=4795 RepID=A0A225V565_9STRA|nr:hypothetical protein PHMEG_00028338 [Phytophthora megakarya]
MRDARILIALWMTTQTCSRLYSALNDLRRRPHDERVRTEHTRIIRIRHYLFVSCLPSTETAPWMKIWTSGTDENLIHVTGLCRKNSELSFDCSQGSRNSTLFLSTGRKVDAHKCLAHGDTTESFSTSLHSPGTLFTIYMVLYRRENYRV